MYTKHTFHGPGPLKNTKLSTIKERLESIKYAIDIVANGDDFAANHGTLGRLMDKQRDIERELRDVQP